jgi:outer membrane biosynthesis protein TonB
MLTALLKSNNQLHWIGGYVYGRTTPRDDQRLGDPFIILYPASERLNHKVTRVYEHDFPKLPAFLDTNVPEAGTVDDNPDRDKALRKRVYHPCEHFLITTYEGKETQMGPEVRFLDVIRTAKPKADAAPAPQPAPVPLPPSPAPVSPAQPTPQPSPKPAPVSSTVPELTERQKHLRALYDYAKSKGLSKGAVDLELAQYHGNPVDTLQALQAENGDRPEPPQHKTVTVAEYWHAVYNVTPRWSQKGGGDLLKQYNGNPTLAYQEMLEKKSQAEPA